MPASIFDMQSLAYARRIAHRT